MWHEVAPMLKLRNLGVAALCLPALLIACGSNDQVGSESDDVTSVEHSDVKDQSTDNCWIYSTTGWVESLHLTATGEKLDLSETYLTYWNYYDQIVAGEVTGGMVEEGGSWGEAADKILKYGMIAEGDFIPPEAGDILSKRQAEALKAVDKALKTGELRYGADRANRAKVRAVLDSAFHLTTHVIAQLDQVFGKDVSKTLDKDWANTPLPAGISIRKPTDFKAKLKNPATNNWDTVTVLEAMGTHKATNNLEHRNGDYAWQEATYPKSATDRRQFLKRVQRALNDHQPIVINWTIDFAALTPDGRFPDVPTAHVGEDQGGHMVLGYDYAVDDVPGYGSLEAGVDATPAQLDAALADEAQVRFLRVKNSWSPNYHNLPPPAPGGYHDLYFKYLNGPMKMCDQDANDKPIPSTCHPGVPLESIVLPAGY
jgi:hypothetical protein